MVPAPQRLNPDNSAAVGVHDRLVIELEGPRRERVGKLTPDESPLVEIHLHFRSEAHDQTAPAPLGGAGCELCMAYEIGNRDAIARGDGKTDAAGNLDDLVGPNRFGDGVA